MFLGYKIGSLLVVYLSQLTGNWHPTAVFVAFLHSMLILCCESTTKFVRPPTIDGVSSVLPLLHLCFDTHTLFLQRPVKSILHV